MSQNSAFIKSFWTPLTNFSSFRSNLGMPALISLSTSRSITRKIPRATAISCGDNFVTKSKLEILNRELLFDGFNRLTKLVYRYRKHNGEWSSAVEREISERSPAAVVLPNDPIQHAAAMVE